MIDGSADDVVGFVHVRDMFAPDVVSRGLRLRDLAREVLLLPGSKRVIPALTEMRHDGHHLAVVVDEYGGTAGIVTSRTSSRSSSATSATSTTMTTSRRRSATPVARSRLKG